MSAPSAAPEQYTYSIAWLAAGVVPLAIGILVDSGRARLASAAVIALTIVKAFLPDMSTLSGVTARGRCWLYQRILPGMPAALTSQPS